MSSLDRFKCRLSTGACQCIWDEEFVVRGPRSENLASNTRRICGQRDCGLRTTDYGLRTADCGLRTADCGLRPDHRPVAAPRRPPRIVEIRRAGRERELG